MKKVHLIGIVVLMILALTLSMLAACGDDETKEPTAPATEPTVPATEPTAPVTEPTVPATEPTAPATEPAAGGPTWEYTVTYEDEVTTWSKAVVGEETIDGVGCYKVETTFDVEPFRYAAPTGTPIKLLDMTEFISKDTLDIKQNAAFSNAMGMIDLTSTQTYKNFSGDHGQPYTFGDKYTFDNAVDLIPDTLAPPYVDTNELEVIAVEDVTVPAGTFRCYKVATTRIGTVDGTGEIGQLLGHEWWAADYTLLAPVKIVRIANWQAEETMVLEMYDPMPEMNADIPDLAGQADPTAEPETWTYNVTGEETVEGVDTYVTEVSFSTVPLRVSPDGRNLRFESFKQWNNKTTYDQVRTDLTLSYELAPESWLEDLLSITTVTYTGDHGIPLSVGQAWTSENFGTLEPKIASDKVTNQAYEVVGMEEITVPMGTYNCYRIEITRSADGAQVRTEWWSEGDEFMAPLKATEYNYMEPEVKEMVSYSADQWVYQVTLGL